MIHTHHTKQARQTRTHSSSAHVRMNRWSNGLDIMTLGVQCEKKGEEETEHIILSRGWRRVKPAMDIPWIEHTTWPYS